VTGDNYDSCESMLLFTMQTSRRQESLGREITKK